MGVLFIGVIIGIIFGLAFGAFGVIIQQRLRNKDRTAVFQMKEETGQVFLNWVRTKGRTPLVKVEGEPTIPTPDGVRPRMFMGRPCFFQDTRSGEYFNPKPGQSMEEPWPDAYDRARAYAGIRERNAADSVNDDNVNWAKYGAIMGAVAVMLLVIIGGFLYNTLKGAV